MATTDNKIINGSGLSELSSQIKSYVNNKSEIAIGDTAPTNANIKIWVDTSIADPPATSISWDNITNKPTIPSIEGLASETYVDEKVATIKVPSLDGYAKTADLSTVATSGSYEDLTNKPTIPAAYELPTASATTLGGVKVGSGLSITDGVLSATGGGTADSVDWSKVQNKPNFANVATSGDYNDLSNKPTIPSVAGLASEAYVNEKVAAIIIPEVPTKVSELENDAGYLTTHQSLAEYAKTADLAQVAKTGSYNDLADKPTIPSTTGLATETYVDSKISEIVIPTVPTKVSAFENDAGYLTEHQSLADYSTTAQVQTMISSAIGAITNGNEVSY